MYRYMDTHGKSHTSIVPKHKHVDQSIRCIHAQCGANDLWLVQQGACYLLKSLLPTARKVEHEATTRSSGLRAFTSSKYNNIGSKLCNPLTLILNVTVSEFVKPCQCLQYRVKICKTAPPIMRADIAWRIGMDIKQQADLLLTFVW